MKTVALLLMLTSAALAQSPGKHNLNNFYASQSRYRKQATEALSKEQVRGKGDLCGGAEAGGIASIAPCLTKEIKVTDEDYREYVRAIGALMRPTPPSTSSSISRKKLPFDSAEAEWRAYRERACESVAAQWEGGDQAQIAYPDCILKVTWNHMNELSTFYSDLLH